ncbi:uncharacterized protein G2W53_015498 [Senna tora]|uniref:Uncharacterized protein n=1 Tax=Senna tora TaxID=362788 RepID=A0A834WUX1_9FABA|nr:uncharacterized protein G2W53_015498 [Senna tora]
MSTLKIDIEKFDGSINFSLWQCDAPDTDDAHVPADGDENTEPNDQLAGEPQVVDDAHLRRSN